MNHRPSIAVLTPNILTGIGLKAILEKVIPMADVELYADFEQLQNVSPERFVHFFVSVQLYRLYASFFTPMRRRVILLTSGLQHEQEAGMHHLNVCNNEEQLVHDLMAMHHGAHPHRGMSETDSTPRTHHLTEREAEVLRLIARGRINKEIADELGIALTTVITHRRNLTEKLHVRSVAELTLYALHAGYVDYETL
ncbi:MAG: helix-turn-helix transcriptional regulator [Alistipes sp.]|nr:helix-turn-helix transcriptional regulator [Alistipes sp.]